MPVWIPQDLPAVRELEDVFVMREERARTQRIRPLQIAVFNVMPKKDVTETQLLRLLGISPIQVKVTLFCPDGHTSRNTSREHLERFYSKCEDVLKERYDALIVTGAPVETIPFEEVKYWEEFCRVMEWSKTHVFATMHLCWGAQAGLYYHFGVQKHLLSQKCSGVFPHKVARKNGKVSRLLWGSDDVFFAPHSRNTETRLSDLRAIEAVDIVGVSQEAGLYLASAYDERLVFVTGHPEYDTYTLAHEYERDRNKGLPVAVPKNYFPDEDATKEPRVLWRAHANLLFANWLNLVYQDTPYDLKDLTSVY